MRLSDKLNGHRILKGRWGSEPGSDHGMFQVPSPVAGRTLTVMLSPGTDTGWEHVSVSADKRAPTWLEMAHVKDLFFAPEECVVQFHVPEAEHVNNHARCLHMWRWTRGEFPRPPSHLVGFKNLGTLTREPGR